MIEIICENCGEDTLVKREPVYDGFEKTGERLICVACGHEYASEAALPCREKRTQTIFDESDKPEASTLFSRDEDLRNCRHCQHYVINPFLQRCGLHHKLVEATDVCDAFVQKPEEAADQDEGNTSEAPPVPEAT